MESPGGRLLTIREAADALGVSVETLRRWAEAGRIEFERTSGGHRRFAPAEVQRLKGQYRVALRPVSPPDAALPSLASVLEDSERLLEAAAQRLYQQKGAGWFGDDASREALASWASDLTAAARDGEWAPALVSTRQMMAAAQRHGATLLERHGFLEAFGSLALRELAAASPSQAELGGARRLFAALRQRLLHEQDAPGPARPVAAPEPDLLGDRLAELLALPDLEWVAFYESDADTLELALRTHAAPEAAKPRLAQRFGLGTGPVGRVALTRRAAVESSNGPASPPMVVAPMSLDGELVGVLTIGLRRARPVASHELRLSEALGAALARAYRGGPRAAEALPRALGAFRAGWATQGEVVGAL